MFGTRIALRELKSAEELVEEVGRFCGRVRGHPVVNPYETENGRECIKQMQDACTWRKSDVLS